MDERQFDDLLRLSALAPSQAATDTAVLLSRQARAAEAGAVPLRRRRPTWLAAAAVAGALSLTGAGSLTAYQLGIPPFQTLEPGVQRTMTGIPVNWVNSSGEAYQCQAFIEYRNLDAEQREQLEQVAADARWDGYGQRVLDSLASPAPTPEEEERAIDEVLDRDVRSAALAAVPAMSESADTDGPALAGWSRSCDIVRDRG